MYIYILYICFKTYQFSFRRVDIVGNACSVYGLKVCTLAQKKRITGEKYFSKERKENKLIGFPVKGHTRINEKILNQTHLRNRKCEYTLRHRNIKCLNMKRAKPVYVEPTAILSLQYLPGGMCVAVPSLGLQQTLETGCRANALSSVRVVACAQSFCDWYTIHCKVKGAHSTIKVGWSLDWLVS